LNKGAKAALIHVLDYESRTPPDRPALLDAQRLIRDVSQPGWNVVICLEANSGDHACHRACSDLGIVKGMDVRHIELEYEGQRIQGRLMKVAFDQAFAVDENAEPGFVKVFSARDPEAAWRTADAAFRDLETPPSPASKGFRHMGLYTRRNPNLIWANQPDWFNLRDARLRVLGGCRMIVSQQADTPEAIFRKVQALLGYGSSKDGRDPKERFLEPQHISIFHEGEDISQAFTEFAKRLSADWFQSMYFS
jgi:hypothetical protein